MGVFWTTIAAEAEVFFAVFVATTIILWVNGSIASRFGRSPWTYRSADFEWKRTGIATLPDVLDFMRHRLAWPFVIAGGASLLAVFVGWGQTQHIVSNLSYAGSCSSFDNLVGAQDEGYNSILSLAVVFNLCDRRFDTPQGCMTWRPMKK